MILKQIEQKYNSCTKCDYCMNDCKVFGYGNHNADIMVVGEGPGGVECETKVPFTGPAGKLLDKILAAIKLERDTLYFTNVVICRTNEKNRTPSWNEIQNCYNRLQEEIEIVKPNIILMVGNPSLKTFFGQHSKVTQCHGQWFVDFKPPYARYFSIMHPAWALHSSTEGELKAKKRTIWNDIKIFRNTLDTINFKLKRNKE